MLKKEVLKKTKVKKAKSKPNPPEETISSNNKYQDPDYLLEAEKYENPIPSRKLILSVISQNARPMTRQDIFTTLNIDDSEQQTALHRRLRAMETDGQLVFTKSKHYALPEKMALLKGVVIGHRDGYGFLRVADEPEDWFIPNSQMQKVIHGDYVLAQPMKADRRGRKEVRIVRIIEDQSKQLVGRFFVEKGLGFVVPDDSRIQHDILIPDEYRMQARMGQVVVVELLARSANLKQPIGHIIEILGEHMQSGMETDIAIRSHNIPYIWSEEIETSVAKLAETVPEEAKKNRVDLRQLPLVTIDGEDARDFDDAIYCQPRKNGGWTLWVAIADVSYYVQVKSELDAEAQNRGTSVYFPTRVVPMLPEKLSNGLCSLNPEEDRLCMVCEMSLDANGKLEEYKFYEAVMNSHARLTYTKVWDILNGDKELRIRYHELVPDLENLYSMFKVLKIARKKRGAIEFEGSETKFVFNQYARIESIEPLIRNDAHKIVEECMILANIAAASLIEKSQVPSLFRIHAEPSVEKLTAFRTFLKELGLSLTGGTKPTPLDYANLLQIVAERPDSELIQTMLLRSLQQAVYSADNLGHFGLALTKYAHFTSPIRRYPDLIVHRTIKYLIKQKQKSAVKKQSTGEWLYGAEEISQLGQQCSMAERRADDATREVTDWLKCEYMQDHIGQEFTGIITSITGFGFFVRLHDLDIDGLVHISTFGDNDYYIFDHARQKLTGKNSGMVYRIGDVVKIKVDAVVLEEKRIHFSLLSSERKPQRLGKTARDKKKFIEVPSKAKKASPRKARKTRANKTKTVK